MNHYRGCAVLLAWACSAPIRLLLSWVVPSIYAEVAQICQQKTATIFQFAFRRTRMRPCMMHCFVAVRSKKPRHCVTEDLWWRVSDLSDDDTTLFCFFICEGYAMPVLELPHNQVCAVRLLFFFVFLLGASSLRVVINILLFGARISVLVWLFFNRVCESKHRIHQPQNKAKSNDNLSSAESVSAEGRD